MRTIHMTDEMKKALQDQREAFIALFGREPTESDPVFWSNGSTKETGPIPITLDELENGG